MDYVFLTGLWRPSCVLQGSCSQPHGRAQGASVCFSNPRCCCLIHKSEMTQASLMRLSLDLCKRFNGHHRARPTNVIKTNSEKSFGPLDCQFGLKWEKKKALHWTLAWRSNIDWAVATAGLYTVYHWNIEMGSLGCFIVCFCSMCLCAFTYTQCVFVVLLNTDVCPGSLSAVGLTLQLWFNYSIFTWFNEQQWKFRLQKVKEHVFYSCRELDVSTEVSSRCN